MNETQVSVQIASRITLCKISMKSIKMVHLQGDHGDLQANFGDR